MVIIHFSEFNICCLETSYFLLIFSYNFEKKPCDKNEFLTSLTDRLKNIIFYKNTVQNWCILVPICITYFLILVVWLIFLITVLPFTCDRYPTQYTRKSIIYRIHMTTNYLYFWMALKNERGFFLNTDVTLVGLLSCVATERVLPISSTPVSPFLHQG